MWFSSVYRPISTCECEIDTIPDLSRRDFLVRLATLGAAASLLPSSVARAWDDPPPLVGQPRWPTYQGRYYSSPPPRTWNRPPPRTWRRPPARAWRQPPPSSWSSPPTARRWSPSWMGGGNLDRQVENYIGQLRQAGRLQPDERTAWLVYDFTSQRFLVQVNTNLSYQSASMIKPFIALAFFEKVQNGQLDYTAFEQQRMEAMIQHSSNRATNYFIGLLGETQDRAGPFATERTLKRNYPGVFRQTRIVEYIPRSGRTYRNRASAMDYHRFLEALWYDQLPYAAELRRLMYLPNRDRIYNGASEVAAGTAVIDKTGTTARLCGNMGILVARGRDGRQYPYSFVGIIQKARPTSRYGAWQRSRGNIIRDVSNMAYSYLRDQYNLV